MINTGLQELFLLLLLLWTSTSLPFSGSLDRECHPSVDEVLVEQLLVPSAAVFNCYVSSHGYLAGLIQRVEYFHGHVTMFVDKMLV